MPPKPPPPPCKTYTTPLLPLRPLRGRKALKIKLPALGCPGCGVGLTPLHSEHAVEFRTAPPLTGCPRRRPSAARTTARPLSQTCRPPAPPGRREGTCVEYSLPGGRTQTHCQQEASALLAAPPLAYHCQEGTRGGTIAGAGSMRCTERLRAQPPRRIARRRAIVRGPPY